MIISKDIVNVIRKDAMTVGKIIVSTVYGLADIGVSCLAISINDKNSSAICTLKECIRV